MKNLTEAQEKVAQEKFEQLQRQMMENLDTSPMPLACKNAAVGMLADWLNKIVMV